MKITMMLTMKNKMIERKTNEENNVIRIYPFIASKI